MARKGAETLGDIMLKSLFSHENVDLMMHAFSDNEKHVHNH